MSFGNKTYAEAFAAHLKAISKKKAKQQKAPKGKKLSLKRVKKVKMIEDKRLMKRWHYLVWEECKRIIRKRNIKPNKKWNCYTCGVELEILSDVQTGHGKPKSVLSAIHKYDLRNLKIQCYNCNINLGGCQDIYIAKLEREEAGLEFLKESCYRTEDGYWKVKHQTESTKTRDHLMKILPILKETDID